MKRAVRVCLPIVLFGIFILAGLIGLVSEQFHNNLFTSASAFVGSFTMLTGLAYKLYSAFMS